jgi:protoporphyrinogen/coproporphyrinogen III oxidase
VLLTSFVGGATDPATTALSERDLVALVHGEIAPVLQIQSAPMFSKVTMYPRALPQYNLGHMERMAAAQQALTKIPGLVLVGNYWRGPAIGACVEQALEVAAAVAARTKRAAEAARS